MILSVPKETGQYERRVAASADTVKRYVALGLEVRVEQGAGLASGISDDDFRATGATIAADAGQCVQGAQIVLCVSPPPSTLVEKFSAGTLLLSTLAPYANKPLLQQCASRNVMAFAMELMPRISRAQSMDVLSSQANLAGYRAVIDAVAALSKATPMMMTAAGTVAPAKVLVLGAGVAGLQAIATAKRLGAAVSAFDVRPAVKEQVQSLGAKFIEVPSGDAENAETKGGYAKEMSEDYKRKQSLLIHETLKKTDIAITTALIPGRPAPVLITPEMVRDMKPGSVIVDLAVASGGNCPLSKPDETVNANGVLIIGHSDMPSRVAVDATPLYARNLYNFIATFFGKDKAFAIPFDDELVKGTLLTRDGAIVQPQFA